MRESIVRLSFLGQPFFQLPVKIENFTSDGLILVVFFLWIEFERQAFHDKLFTI